MSDFVQEPSVGLAIVCAGLMLMVGMLTGTWKFVEMLRSDTATAPRYVNIAHRAALLYACAFGVLALLAGLSVFSQPVELAAVGINALFFFIATGTYVRHGFLQTPKTQYLQKNFTTGAGTWILAVAETGATGVLTVGAILGLMQAW